MLRRRSLTTRLTLSHLAATVVAMLLLGSSFLLLVARRERTAMLASLQSAADVDAAYGATLAGDEATLRAQAEAIAIRFPLPPDGQVRLFGTNGSLLLRSSPLGPFPSRAVRPYLNAILLPPVGQDPGRRYTAAPIVVRGATIGVVELSQSLDREQRLLHSLLLALALAAVVAALGAAALGLLLAHTLIRPLHRLGHVAAAIAAGDLAVRSEDRSPDEIGRLATQINTMAAELEARIAQTEALAAARQQFFRSVSHELRTPLTAIRGMAENLEDDAIPVQVEALAIIKQETARLQLLVEELLQPGQQELVPLRRHAVFDLYALAEECCRLLQPRARRAGVDFDIHLVGNAPIDGDRDRMKQALLNILDNALKWTPPGGRIVLNGIRDTARVMLGIGDTGPGIPPELRAAVWERGTHGPDGGQGLGLALVREVIAAHGGTVRILDVPGTTIDISLPVATASPVAAL